MSDSKHSTAKEGFSSRWSRRKQQVKLEQDTRYANTDEPLEQPATKEALAEQARLEKLAQLNTLKDEDMPDISSLDENSDFSQFMSNNVSEALRKIALRKLFQGETYNIRDGLDEYDGDYTSFEKLDPGTITADMKYRQELEAEKRKAELEKERIENLEADLERDADLEHDAELIEDPETVESDQDEAMQIEAEADSETESDNKEVAVDGAQSEILQEQNRPANELTEETNKEEII